MDSPHDARLCRSDGPPPGATVLRQLSGRAVWVEPGPPEQVVKLWRARSPWRRLFDRRRARAEWRGLLWAKARGLPAPEPIQWEQLADAQRLRTRRIPDAWPLEHWRSRGATEEFLARGAEALGVLLARVQSEGLALSDGHLGNFPVDAGGNAWISDFGRSAPARPCPRRAFAEAARLVGEARDRLGLDAAARLARAWLQGGPGQRSPAARQSLELALFQRAVGDRRSRVRRAQDRWLRASGHLEALPGGLWRRDLASGLRAAIGAAGPELRAVWEGRAAVGLSDRSGGALLGAWLQAGRLHDHGLPTALPAHRKRGAGAVFWWELPGGAAPELSQWPELLASRGLSAGPPIAYLAHGERGPWPLWGALKPLGQRER